MAAPDTLALIRDVYLQIEKHIVLCHVTQSRGTKTSIHLPPRRLRH